MFRIECFVTDKHLPDVLRALGQRVLNLNVQPVVDAEVRKAPKGEKEKRGKLVGTNGGSLSSFLNELRKEPVINRGTAEAAAQRAGFKPASATYLLRKARDQRLIKTKGSTSNLTYSWAEKTPAPARKSAGMDKPKAGA